jgi:hypothetical protein
LNRSETISSGGGNILVVKVLAIASLLGIFKIAEAVTWELGLDNSLGRGDHTGSRGAGTGQNPDVLFLKEEELWLAGVDDCVVFVVSIQNTVVTISEKEEANLALSTVALGSAFYFINLSPVELRVMNFNDAVALKAILGLCAFTILEDDALISGIFLPHSKIFINIEVGLELMLAAKTEVPLALNSLKE